MPEYIRVRTRCVETAWHGGCERYEATCNQAQVNAIGAALDSIYAKVDGCDLRNLTSLKNCIKNAHDTVVWKCASLGSGIVAQQSGSEITLTPTAFGSTTSRFEAIVFHEVVHRCGGTELDSEALENHCYRGSGATAPCCGDMGKFCDDGGSFVNWSASSGSVSVKSTGQSLNINTSDFTHPSGSCGGGDGGW